MNLELCQQMEILQIKKIIKKTTAIRRSSQLATRLKKQAKSILPRLVSEKQREKVVVKL